MKRAVATIFLFIILLNVAGYYVVMEGWRRHVSVSWSDANLNKNQEMVVRIPLEVPYNTKNGEWEPANGQFEFQGEIYRITQQKIDLDAVYLACIKDTESNQINQQLGEFVKTFSDKPSDSKSSPKVFHGFIKEYFSERIGVTYEHQGWVLNKVLSTFIVSIVSSFEHSILLPPEGR